MDAIECLKTRRSIRSYTDKKVSKEVLTELIDCARLAPSARNEQPWEFVVVTGKETKQKIADITAHGRFIADAAACIIVCSKKSDYFLEDCSAATENILLAARAFGISTCWVAGHKKDYSEDAKKLLRIPDEYLVISFISLGYSDGQPEPHGKRTVEEVIHWEKF